MGASEARAQQQAGTITFNPGNPVWSNAPNRSWSAQFTYAPNPGYVTRGVTYAVYIVTFPNGMRTESLLSGQSQIAPPLPQSGTAGGGGALSNPGTYCVKIMLHCFLNGMPAPSVVVTSPDQVVQ